MFLSFFISIFVVDENIFTGLHITWDCVCVCIFHVILVQLGANSLSFVSHLPVRSVNAPFMEIVSCLFDSLSSNEKKKDSKFCVIVMDGVLVFCAKWCVFGVYVFVSFVVLINNWGATATFLFSTKNSEKHYINYKDDPSKKISTLQYSSAPSFGSLLLLTFTLTFYRFYRIGYIGKIRVGRTNQACNDIYSSSDTKSLTKLFKTSKE